MCNPMESRNIGEDDIECLSAAQGSVGSNLKALMVCAGVPSTTNATGWLHDHSLPAAVLKSSHQAVAGFNLETLSIRPDANATQLIQSLVSRERGRAVLTTRL